VHKLSKLVLALVVAALLAPIASAQTIKIAFLGPLTGGAAFIGQEAMGFTSVVIDAFNARTGLNVELIEGDTEINPDTGRIVAERVAADSDVLVVVGPMGSQVCESTQPVFESAGLGHVTQSCTSTGLTDPGTATFFRPIPNDSDQSRTIVDYWLDVLGADSFFMVDDQSSYAVGLNDEVENLLLDADIITYDRASITQDEIDFSSIATAAIRSDADVVFFPNQISSQAAGLAIALAQQGFEGTYFLPDGGFSLEWVEIAGEAAEGALVTFFAPDPNQVAAMQPFNDAYRAQFADAFGAFGGASALATFVALDAIERCIDDLTRTCVVDALGSTDLMTTPMGVPVSFGEGNQASGSAFFLFEVIDGVFALIE
jgi:branched-chain amino acid transport system substrate-binding protein